MTDLSRECVTRVVSRAEHGHAAAAPSSTGSHPQGPLSFRGKKVRMRDSPRRRSVVISVLMFAARISWFAVTAIFATILVIVAVAVLIVSVVFRNIFRVFPS